MVADCLAMQKDQQLPGNPQAWSKQQSLSGSVLGLLTHMHCFHSPSFPVRGGDY